MSKLVLVAVAAAAYALGAHDGRERYEQLKARTRWIWGHPRVQEKKSEAAEAVRAKAPGVKDSVAGAAKSAADKVKSTAMSDDVTSPSVSSGS